MAKCSLGCLKLSPVSLLVYLCLLNILMYLDRGVLSSLVPALQDDARVHLTNFQSGVLGSVFMFGFMVASPLFANASQTIHPFTLIAIGISIWGGSVLLAAVSRSFWLLAASRTLSGIGEASFVCLAAPIILSKAPADKKNLWISLFYSALTIGYALGYVIAPPVKNSFNGWYYVFYLEAVASIPFILIALFAHRDPTLFFKKEHKVSLSTQFKELWGNSTYVLLVIGYGAYSFTVGGLAFWGPTILQKQFDQSETVATFSLGAITIISGLFATLSGSIILEKITKVYRLEFGENKITQRKFSYYITEKASKLITIVTGIACAIALVGAIISPALDGSGAIGSFAFFLICIGVAEFSLFMGVGPANMGMMNSVNEDLRPQAVAVAIFFMHLLGDFPSPFLIGVINDGMGMYWGTCILMAWLIFAVILWGLGFNISRFHGASKEYIKKHFCSKDIIKKEDVNRLLTADADDVSTESFTQPKPNKSVQRIKEDELI